MFVDNHTLHIDFPQYKDKIASLSSINDKFKRLVDDYNKLTKSIEGLESRNIPVDDGHFTLMKMERAHLKDKLFQQLHHN